MAESHSVVSKSLWPHVLYSPWNSPGQNTGGGSLSLLQGILPTQGSNPGLPHCRRILYQPSHQGSPKILEWVAYPFSRTSSRPRNQTGVFCIAGGFFSIKHYDTFTTRTQKRMCNANCWLKDHHIVSQFHNLDHFPKALFQSSNLPAKSTISFNLFLLNKYRIL